MSIEDRVTELVKEKISDRPELFLVGVTMQSDGKLLIAVDGDQGISIQDCAAISRHVGFHLEEENVIEDAYNLEVSSPGVDAPIKLLRQYAKNIGRSLSLKMLGGHLREGKLLEVNQEEIKISETIKEKGKKAVQAEDTIPLNQIIETKVLISFN